MSEILLAPDGDTPAITPEQARQALAAEQQQRARACEEAIEQVLAAYRCTLDVGLLLRAGAAPEPALRVIALA